MATTFKVKMDGRFQKEARGRIEKFYFETGVLEDKPHRLPKKRLKGEKTNSPGLLKTYAGGPARATGRRKSGLTIAQVSERLRKNTGINFYTRPWKKTASKASTDLVRFIRSFMKLITQGGKLQEKKRLENALQAVVRNPILRGEYGKNSPATAKAKGFNRFMIDTAQLFRAIKSRVRLRRVS